MHATTLWVAGIFACLASAALAVETPEITSSKNEVSIGRLDELVRRIQEENPAVRAAQAAVEAARAKRDAADRPLHNPTLELEVEHAADITAAAGFNQTIDWSGKRGIYTQIAGAELAVAKATLATVRRRVAVEVLTALSHYQSARELRKLAVRRTRLMQEFAETTERRLSAGDVNRLDVTLARVAHSEARIQQGRADTALIEAEAALRAVSGFALAQWPNLPDELPQFSGESGIEQLLAELPELTVLQRLTDTARARVELARRERRPDPTIGVRAGREGDDALLGLRLEIPLFVRNSFHSEVQAASQEALKVEQDFLEARRRAEARLGGAKARYRAATAVWKDLHEADQSALVEQVELLERLWRAGELSATDYLIQAKQNVDTQVSATELAGDIWQAAIAWLEASGQVERWLSLKSTSPADATNSGAQ